MKNAVSLKKLRIQNIILFFIELNIKFVRLLPSQLKITNKNRDIYKNNLKIKLVHVLDNKNASKMQYNFFYIGGVQKNNIFILTIKYYEHN